jgi:hypothetical protein
MMSWVTDKRFLVGAAVGFFIVPYLTKNARGLLDKVKGGGA